MNPGWILVSLLDLVYPERCTLCGAEPGSVPWTARGDRVPGLRFWDETHLCRVCAHGLIRDGASGLLTTGSGTALPVVAAASTNPALVELVGRFKYDGVRGLAWPLARLLREPMEEARIRFGSVDALVPIPLHGRRCRERGFNQAGILSRLLGAAMGLPSRSDILVRRRSTEQQARITSVDERARNLAAAFAVRCPAPGPGGVGLGLLDDLVTSGGTVLAAAEPLRAAGWNVKWVLSLGLAGDPKNSRARVDTRERGF